MYLWEIDFQSTFAYRVNLDKDGDRGGEKSRKGGHETTRTIELREDRLPLFRLFNDYEISLGQFVRCILRLLKRKVSPDNYLPRIFLFRDIILRPQTYTFHIPSIRPYTYTPSSRPLRKNIKKFKIRKDVSTSRSGWTMCMYTVYESSWRELLPSTHVDS